ncbi:MAG: DUF2892 domain-containing protein [Nitrospiria bacterium]
MKCNVGKKDRTMRMIVGLAVIGLGLYLGAWWGAVGLIPLLTGAFAAGARSISCSAFRPVI